MCVLPLIRLNADDAPAKVYLKPENLQPIGSFKIRRLGNAMLQAGGKQLSKGVWTASMGNAAQAVAWHARRLRLPCTIVVPEAAVETKLAAIRRLGGQIVRMPYDTWWQTFRTHEFEGQEGVFIHPFADPAVIAGNGTIDLEILEDLPDVNSVVVPFGGGGLSCGIAAVMKALKPSIQVYACEVETAAARLLAVRNCLVAEGAGASSVAAALTGGAGGGKVVCIISGGNIDAETLSKILQGQIPSPG